MTPNLSASANSAVKPVESRAAVTQGQAQSPHDNSAAAPVKPMEFNEAMKQLSSNVDSDRDTAKLAEQETLLLMLEQEPLPALHSERATETLQEQLTPMDLAQQLGTLTWPLPSEEMSPITSEKNLVSVDGEASDPKTDGIHAQEVSTVQSVFELLSLSSQENPSIALMQRFSVSGENLIPQEQTPRGERTLKNASPPLSSLTNTSLLNAALPAFTESTRIASAAITDPSVLSPNVSMPLTSGAATQELAPLKLQAGAPAQWRQSLMEALGDRIQVSIAHRSEQATIRLDPPMMGSVEIMIRHEAGALHIQMNASHSEVQKQLQAISDNLKQELTQRQYAGVTVQVSDSAMDNEGRQRQRYLSQTTDEPFGAMENSDASLASPFALLTDKD